MNPTLNLPSLLCRADNLHLFYMMLRSKTTRVMQWSDQASHIEPMVGPSTGYTHDLISDNAKHNDVSLSNLPSPRGRLSLLYDLAYADADLDISCVVPYRGHPNYAFSLFV